MPTPASGKVVVPHLTRCPPPQIQARLRLLALVGGTAKASPAAAGAGVPKVQSPSRPALVMPEPPLPTALQRILATPGKKPAPSPLPAAPLLPPQPAMARVTPERTAAAKKAARARKSSKRVAQHGRNLRATTGENSILENRSAGAPAQADYERKIGLFTSFTKRHDLADSPESFGFEGVARDFMGQRYPGGHARGWGDWLKAPLEWQWSELSRKGTPRMPRVARALRGWRKTGPNQLQ